MALSFHTPGETSSGKALVIHPVIAQKATGRDLDETLEEAAGLARAIHLEVLDVRTAKVIRINPALFLGKGTAENLGTEISNLKPDVVIFNHNLSPVQQRNLEKQWNAKVIDRTGLILEIFGERAQTREGTIQVELAALEYQKSRLVKSWSHLERQRGGLGKTGGPGERQIELDRRIIADRISQLKKDLEKVRKTRELGRKARERVPYPIIALVGYTNAGKSTLFNRLTGAGAFAEDLPFATLDPTLRKIKLPTGQEAILSDTVGFISDLPTHLVASFRATLEQVQAADVILHVRDYARADTEAQKQDVIDILNDLGIEYETDERIFEVLNKIDIRKEPVAYMSEYSFPVSAVTGEGIELLLKEIATYLSRKRTSEVYMLAAEEGKALAWLHAHGDVLHQETVDEGIQLEVRLEPRDIQKFYKSFGHYPVGYQPEEESYANA